jgi:signal peptidase I
MVNTYGMVRAHDLFSLIKKTLLEGKKVKFTVNGNSMLPWILHNRDKVLLTGADKSNIKVGSIVLYVNNCNKYILHRIYKEEADGYHTIGDGCLVEDGTIRASEIIGVVEKIYHKGREIDCNSLFWKSIFNAWRILLPVRKYLLCIYFLIRKLKRGFGKYLTVPSVRNESSQP